MAPPVPFVAALASALVSAAGWGAGALTSSGAVAAWAVGAAILHGAGWGGGAVLLTFFVGSSAVGRLGPPRPGSALDPKGERRDHLQVLANGGAAAAGALLAAHTPAALWLVAGGLASAAADTWATAWGASSPTLPRHLLTGRAVPTGTSGGITPLGTGGALAGALVTALAGAPWTDGRFVGAVAGIGVAGMLLDSLLGATVQGRFHCPACDRTSEWPRHRCGTPTTRTGGWPWLDNDGVNALATTAGACAGWLAWRSLAGG